MPITPFSLCKIISAPAGKWLATRVGKPMPRFTTAPSLMSAATRAAIWSRFHLFIVGSLSGSSLEAGRAGGRARHLHDALHEQARRDDVFGIDAAQFGNLVHGSNTDLGSHGHDGAEVARRLAVSQVAPAVTLLCLDQGKVGVEWGLQHIHAAIDFARFL